MLRMVCLSSFMQLVVTFAGQVFLLALQDGATAGSSFYALLILNIVFSCIKLLVVALEVTLKFGVLAGLSIGHRASPTPHTALPLTQAQPHSVESNGAEQVAGEDDVDVEDALEEEEAEGGGVSQAPFSFFRGWGGMSKA